MADRSHAFAVLKRGYRALLFAFAGSSAGFQPASGKKAGRMPALLRIAVFRSILHPPGNPHAQN